MVNMRQKHTQQGHGAQAEPSAADSGNGRGIDSLQAVTDEKMGNEKPQAQDAG